MKDSISQEGIKRYVNLITSITGSVVAQTAGATKEQGLVKYRFGISALKDRNIHVYIDEEKVTVDIYINVVYGYRVPEVVCNIQENVKKRVEKSTPFEISSINVFVSNVIFE